MWFLFRHTLSHYPWYSSGLQICKNITDHLTSIAFDSNFWCKSNILSCVSMGKYELWINHTMLPMPFLPCHCHSNLQMFFFLFCTWLHTSENPMLMPMWWVWVQLQSCLAEAEAGACVQAQVHQTATSWVLLFSAQHKHTDFHLLHECKAHHCHPLMLMLLLILMNETGG